MPFFTKTFPALFLLMLSMPAGAQTPLWRAHAHNDYVHDRPLLDALDRGIGSVEVDVHLVDGQLLVAHDLEDVDPEKTIGSLYLDPLQQWIKERGGQVYDTPGSLILLVDIKSEAEASYLVLKEVLRTYAGMLTRYEGNRTEEGAVTVIVSGNRPRALMLSENERWAAYDGRLEDLGQPDPLPVSFMPLVSSNWNQVAHWYGHGALADSSRKALQKWVSQAHAEGRKLRFWATSDNPEVWQVLYDAGVDLLNADDLDAVRHFLMKR